MKTNQTILSLLDSLKDAQVMCVGDIMLDRFISGKVERISPEGPIPILQITSEKSMLGGAGNVVRNLRTLGARVRFLSVIGSDPAGSEISKMILEDADIKATLIVDSKRETSIKTRFLASNQQILRSDKETSIDISPRHRKKLLQLANKNIAIYGALILSDYGKGVLTEDLIQELIALANDAHVPIIVDPKGDDYSCYLGATLITPNRNELEQATKMPVDNDESIVLAANYLIKKYRFQSVLVTRSSDGMTLVTKRNICHFTAEAREVFDVSGAGDTVVATMGSAISVGSNIENAARLANTAAGLVVGKFGTAVVYLSELKNALFPQSILKSKIKILNTSKVSALVTKWHKQGLIVGFTNGCFDILHPGHLSLLNQAKANCDKLIVGLNTDKSIKRLKGKHRPINSELARAEILAALTEVDAVTLFDEETPINLIKLFKPNILIKGADYSEKKVIGANFVIKNGGKVILAKLKKGYSTSAALDRALIPSN